MELFKERDCICNNGGDMGHHLCVGKKKWMISSLSPIRFQLMSDVFGQSAESQNSIRGPKDAEVASCCKYTLAKTDLWAGTSPDLCYSGAFPNNQAIKGVKLLLHGNNFTPLCSICTAAVSKQSLAVKD